MSSLREDHAYLYKRARLKALVHILIGLVFITFPEDPNPRNGALSSIQHKVGELLLIIGWAYLFLGLAIAVGLFISRRNYAFARTAMGLATAFNVAWVLLISAILFQHATRGVAYVVVLSAYLTYNCWYVFKDPGWKAIQIVKNLAKEAEDERDTSALG